ncbi:hypothetical protein [Catenulispora subtropica]|uniref:Uncharacterized protein n=1 Tax=Catenulispora subtropica TaxID=450798 RepID=A0ABP5DMT4_9ACTN
MIGYELEVDLAVTDEDGDYIEGDTHLALSTTVPSFTLVTDARLLNDDNLYSNIEFVTDPVSVIGTRHATGPAIVLAQLDAVRAARDALYFAGEGPLADADETLTTVGAGDTALLNPNLGYDETFTLLAHYSVGVPLAGMPHFFDRLRDAAPIPDYDDVSPVLVRARFSLFQAESFADCEIRLFLETPGAPAAGSAETRALCGYLQLAYMQICALADNLDVQGEGAQIKNLTAVLCRSAFIDVFPLLCAEARAYLRSRCEGDAPIITNLADHQEVPQPGGEEWTFHEDGVRQSGTLEAITLGAFALSVFNGEPRVEPQRVFGGMREIAPHEEEGAAVVPFEIRTIGAQEKDWAEVRADLEALCTWCEEAYRRA